MPRPWARPFTYQGRLVDGGAAATGVYDVQFALYDDASAGGPVGSELVKEDVAVTNGLFMVELDFGPGIFNGNARWLALGVRAGASTGAFATLPVRQALTPAPNALFAATAATAASVAAANITGSLSDAQLSANVALLSSSPTFTGSVTATGFNSSGSTPLEFNVNSTRALRLEPGSSSGAPNVIGGSPSNFATSGTTGATIAGGGATGFSLANQVTGEFGTVGGGLFNISASYATIGGGRENNSYGGFATIGGGTENDSLDYATVGGGYGNTSSGYYTTVGGGAQNSSRGDAATVGGGGSNTSSTNLATVSGGYGNTSSGYSATVGGGYSNTSSGYAATVPGGEQNLAEEDYSFAAGRRAKANHIGAFVWGDSTEADVASSATNEFTVRASGGVRLFSNPSPRWRPTAWN